MTHFWIRTAMIGAAAGALAACATAPQYPTQEGQAPVQREMPRPAYPITQADPDEGPAPAAQPSTGVDSQPLAPPATLAPPPAVDSAPLAPLAEASPAPQLYVPPPEPVTRTRTATSVAGKVVAAEGKPETYVVKSGEGLDAIARKLDTTRKQLAADNDLKEPFKIKPGQKLKGPAVKGKAYVVGQGDTLYAIAKRFSVKASDMAQANGFEVGDPIRPGQKILLPSGFKDTGPITRTVTETVTPAWTPPAPTPVATPTPQPQPQPPVLRPAIPATPPPPVVTTQPRPYTPPPVSRPVVAEPRTPPPSTASPIISTSAVPTDNEVAAAGRGRFVWPVKGEVVSPFGPKGLVGQRNDGLNIRAAAGSSVTSAAAGTVVYAGDQVPGFGNLVLVKHEGGWVTAYAHMARVDVKMQDVVTQGQQLGQVGATGGVSEPQLHFEVRYAPSPKDKARPIDPALVLPR